MINFKQKSGITLIALIITIIILLILAGVVINMTLGNDGIISKAQVAVNAYNDSRVAETGMLQTISNTFGEYLDKIGEVGGDVPVSTSLQPTAVVATNNAEITYDANGGTGDITNGFTAPLGNGFKGWNTSADGSGIMYAPGDEVSTSGTLYAIWGGTYRLGQEVTIGTGANAQNFYVLIDDNTNANGNVTLLAKYNLDKSPVPNDSTGKYYQKVNATNSETACGFSSTNYWSSDWSSGTRINLNTYTTDTVANTKGQTKSNNAIMRARDYAKNTINSSAEGRLLTYEEANALIDIDTYADMISGSANTNEDGNYLIYWLASTRHDTNFDLCLVWGMYGLGREGWSNDTEIGCRPVILVSKSLIE